MEAVTNVPVVVNMERLKTWTASISFEACVTNEVLIALGCDANADGDLAFDEADMLFGCDCGGWYRADLRTGETFVASPGLKWLASSGAGVLLGYAYYAPLDSQGGVDIVRQWCDTRTSLGDVDAWMKANDCRSGHNACAITRLTQGRLEYRYFKRDDNNLIGLTYHTYSEQVEIMEVE